MCQILISLLKTVLRKPAHYTLLFYNPSGIFLRKRHLPLHKGGFFYVVKWSCGFWKKVSRMKRAAPWAPTASGKAVEVTVTG